MPDYRRRRCACCWQRSGLGCLKKDQNVELVRTGIERVVAERIVTVDWRASPRPSIIWTTATGFLPT
jgi:hypothetical protein